MVYKQLVLVFYVFFLVHNKLLWHRGFVEKNEPKPDAGDYLNEEKQKVWIVRQEV